MKNTVCSWSGGKDSCYALIQAVGLGYVPKVLLNVLNEEGKISRSHGIPSSILKAQAAAAGIPVHMVSSSWQEYEANFTGSLNHLKKEYDLNYAVFGDIDLDPHREWEEKVCRNAGLTAILPLWKQDRRSLVMQMLDTPIRCMIVSCNETMGEKFIGRILDQQTINELDLIGIDPCGENGEFHTLVLDCPLFSSAIDVRVEKVLHHEKYWFGQLIQ